MLHISEIMASILFYGTALLLLSETIISANIFLLLYQDRKILVLYPVFIQAEHDKAIFTYYFLIRNLETKY
jgi:hypothetical protein